jgi:hypothetical protein
MTTQEARPGVASGAGSEKVGETTASVPRWTLAHGIRQRRKAAQRLPPLACGCRDPLALEHLDQRCRYRMVRCA